MSLLEFALALVFLHFLGDFVLQGEFLAREKGRSSYLLLVHGVLYAGPFYLLGLGPPGVLIVFASHLLIDWGKARAHRYGLLIDQALHFGVLAGVIAARLGGLL